MSEAIAHRVASVSPDCPQGQRLQVVPILGASHYRPDYELLRQETLSKVLVMETSEAGTVPELRVQNLLDIRVFLMDGQELVGAKQNRILNTDVVVPAGGTVHIPVSCVEQGRWHLVSSQFSSGKAASHRIRSAKLQRVHDSLQSGGRHDANQEAVWHEVQQSLSASGVDSDTMALSDAYARRQKDLETFRRDLRLPSEVVGLAVFRSGRFQGLDLFDRHSTLQYFWQSLVDSYALDLLDAATEQAGVSDESQQVRSILSGISQGKWESFRSPGEGVDWRLQDGRYAASSTVWDESVVLHLQVFPKAEAGAGGETGGYRPRIRRRYGHAK